MSLTKKPTMTPEKIAANQAIAKRSQGPATPEGRERTREAGSRHGLYARPAREGLRALGEDDRDIGDLITTWRPANEFDARLLRRLARALWPLELDDPWCESLAVRQMQTLDENLARLKDEAEARLRQQQAAMNRLRNAANKEELCAALARFSDFARRPGCLSPTPTLGQSAEAPQGQASTGDGTGAGGAVVAENGEKSQTNLVSPQRSTT
jgi:hypothetical protein